MRRRAACYHCGSRKRQYVAVSIHDPHGDYTVSCRHCGSSLLCDVPPSVPIRAANRTADELMPTLATVPQSVAGRMELREAIVVDLVAETRRRDGERAARRLEKRLRAHLAATNERDRGRAARQA